MANHCIRAGQSGNGSAWNNAYGSLPATLIRGDIYYIADGTYGGYVFDDSASGTTLITIKKATVAAHGPVTGWDNTYGDGVATFSSQLDFKTPFYLVDGVTGGGPGSWRSGFGFKVTCMDSNLAALRINFGIPANTAHDITIRHVEVQGKGSVGGGGSYGNDGLAIYGAANIRLSHAWFYAIGRCPFFIDAQNLIVEYGCFERFYSSLGVHSEIASIWKLGDLAVGDVTFRYNLFTHAESTGGIMWDNSSNPSSHLYVYRNVFYRPAGAAVWKAPHGMVGGWSTNSQFHNAHVLYNTFIDILDVDAEILGTQPQVSSGGDARGNYFYNCKTPSFFKFPTNGYNHFNATSGGGANSSTSSGDPFTNKAGLDFTLTSNTPAGTNLGAPYNIDPLGRAVTTWTRGAYEHSSSTTPVISVSPSFLNFGSTAVGNSVDRIPSVTNTGGGRLIGTVVTTSPYSVVSEAVYDLTSGQSRDVTVRFTPTAIGTATEDLNFNGEAGSPGDRIPMTGDGAGILGLEFDADEGTIEAPFTIDGSGNVSQSIDTQGDVAAGGRATYTFNAPAGNYSILVSVNAPNPAENSFYVNIDAEPTDPTMTWDVVQTTTGFEDRSVYWRGAGTFDAPEFQPKVFILTAGVHQLIIVGREANAALAHITFILVSPVSIIPATPPNGVVNTPYSLQFNATGGQPPYIWSNGPGSYPPGITLSSTTGLLSGTPTQDGTFSWSIRAEDANNEEASLAISVVIDPEVIPLSVTTTSIPSATADVAYSYTFQATGGTLPYTWTLTGGGLPPGLSLASSGEISGTPTPLGSDDIYLIDVTVEDADSNSASRENLTIIVLDGLDSVPAIISVI